MTERQRLLTQYFPVRTANVLSYIMDYVDIDDFEAPDDWTEFTASMFHEWNGTGANAKPTATVVNTEWNMKRNVSGGSTVAGFTSVSYNLFADVSPYDKLVLRGTGSGLRILANRLVAHGPWKQIVVSFDESSPYWDSSLQALVFPLSDLKTVATSEGLERIDDFVHLNALKVDWSKSVNLTAAYLTPGEEMLAVRPAFADSDRSSSFADSDRSSAFADNARFSAVYYNLSGQQVARPTKGIYIYRGRKVVIR
jgi:hypothetical protein